jgi:hypothetical protein
MELSCGYNNRNQDAHVCCLHACAGDGGEKADGPFNQLASFVPPFSFNLA